MRSKKCLRKKVKLSLCKVGSEKISGLSSIKSSSSFKDRAKVRGKRIRRFGKRIKKRDQRIIRKLKIKRF